MNDHFRSFRTRGINEFDFSKKSLVVGRVRISIIAFQMNSIRYWVGEKVSRTRVLGVGISVAYPVSILSQISPLLLSKVNTRGLIYHSVRGSRVIFSPNFHFRREENLSSRVILEMKKLPVKFFSQILFHLNNRFCTFPIRLVEFNVFHERKVYLCIRGQRTMDTILNGGWNNISGASIEEKSFFAPRLENR